jgi:hypothetical protein
VFVHFDHVARFIENPNHGTMSLMLASNLLNRAKVLCALRPFRSESLRLLRRMIRLQEKKLAWSCSKPAD